MLNFVALIPPDTDPLILPEVLELLEETRGPEFKKGPFRRLLATILFAWQEQALGTEALTATSELLDEARANAPKCDNCGKQAACLGAYEDGLEAYACNECCDHGNEDGHCVMLADLPRVVGDLRARASDEPFFETVVAEARVAELEELCQSILEAPPAAQRGGLQFEWHHGTKLSDVLRSGAANHRARVAGAQRGVEPVEGRDFERMPESELQAALRASVKAAERKRGNRRG